MAERTQRGRADGVADAPYGCEEIIERTQIRHALELPDGYGHQAMRSRRPAASDPAWKTSAPTIAIANASAMPSASSRKASTAKKAAKLNNPSRSPRITAIAAPVPSCLCANTQSTAA